MAIQYLEIAPGIASSSNWHTELYCIHHSLAESFFDENRFVDAHTHIGYARLHGINNPHWLGYAMELQATFWYKERKFKEATSEALCAVETYGNVEAIEGAEAYRNILQNIGEQMEKLAITR